MYLKQFQSYDWDKLRELYTDFQFLSCFLDMHPPENILFYTINHNYSFVFSKYLEKTTNPFRSLSFQDNLYLQNEFILQLDIADWNIQVFKEFMDTQVRLKNILGIQNLFILYNFEQLDRDTQNKIGSYLTEYRHNACFWLICQKLTRVIPKISNRIIIGKIRAPKDEQVKQYLLDITKDQPYFEIIIDKIVEKSNNDYRTAVMYLDMIQYDASILNRDIFEKDYNELLQYVENNDICENNYPKVREICYHLLEMAELAEIFSSFISFLMKYLVKDHMIFAVNRAAEYQTQDKILNKQIWLLETWILDIILYKKKKFINSSQSRLVI